MINKPLDIALQKIDQHFFNNPEAIKQLKILEKHHDNIERIKKELDNAKILYKNECEKMTNILELLNLRQYSLGPNFECFEKTYHEVEVIDKKAFFKWLKENCTPDEIIEFLTPPTTKGDIKKFINKKLEDKNEDIPGLDLKAVFTVLKTRRKKHEYKKEQRDTKDDFTYRKKRAYGYGTTKRSK